MKLIKKALILGLTGAALAQDDEISGEARRKRPSKPVRPAVEKTLTERIESNVEVAKRQLAKLVNPNDTKEDALMMKMYEAKIDSNGGLSDSLMGTLLSAVDGDDINIDRNLGCSGVGCKVNLSLSGIWEYGCWCSFGPQLLNGGGTPVSPHDEFCMSMTKCLRCAEADTAGCDAITTTYDIAADFNPDNGQQALEAACDAVNGNDPCKTHVCMCETNLLSSIVNAVWDGVVYDASFLHGQDFDTSQCSHSGGDGGGTGSGGSTDNDPKDCCGFYPDRVPFVANNGRKCCSVDQVFFSELDSQCCSNGVQLLGNPCPNPP